MSQILMALSLPPVISTPLFMCICRHCTVLYEGCALRVRMQWLGARALEKSMWGGGAR
jgi:hypothetical protein